MSQLQRDPPSVSLAMTGSGGAGVITSGEILLEAAAKAGLYGLLTRSVGAQIRGGEAAAMLRLAPQLVTGPDDYYDLLVAMDWANIERFAAEIPLDGRSLIIADPAAGPVPEVIAASSARVREVALGALAKAIPGGRSNMVALGVVAQLVGLPLAELEAALAARLAAKGEAAVAAGRAALKSGASAAADLDGVPRLAGEPLSEGRRWLISGNQAAGFGALRGGVRFAAGYPITPASDLLEWLASTLPKLGGLLVQAEDEVAAINMVLGASYGGVPALTATSGPGFSLMVESLGLAVTAEIPLVVINVMRGGPSTGLPTKSEQADLELALYGRHGDAPLIVVAPQSVEDCLMTTQWAVHLAESLQVAVLVLSDQYLGQARAILDPPASVDFLTRRAVASEPAVGYSRYALTGTGVSPMATPGIPGGQYTADGLAHDERGLPSSRADHHAAQLAKRQHKIAAFDYGARWGTVEGDGAVAILAWGSLTAAAREAAGRARAEGLAVRLIAPRLIAPAARDAMATALQGVNAALVVEQTHSGQFLRYLRAHYDLPAKIDWLGRPGPLPIRPGEILDALMRLSLRRL